MVESLITAILKKLFCVVFFNGLLVELSGLLKLLEFYGLQVTEDFFS